MAQDEKRLFTAYQVARAAYDLLPSIATAASVLKAATALVEISDDYTELLDEADDIHAEPV